MPTPLRPGRPAMVTLSREEATARIARHLAGLKRRLERLRGELRSPGRASGYVLNVQVGAVKREIRRWRDQAARIRRQTGAEATLPDGIGA